MRSKHPGRSNAEWMDLITECRQSGLSDSVWCDQHNIPKSSFYNAVTRLRKMACAIRTRCLTPLNFYKRIDMY